MVTADKVRMLPPGTLKKSGSYPRWCVLSRALWGSAGGQLPWISQSLRVP